MDNLKNDNYYARKIIENIDAIEKYVEGVSYEQFVKDGELVDAVMFRFVQLIENIGNIQLTLKIIISKFLGVKSWDLETE